MTQAEIIVKLREAYKTVTGTVVSEKEFSMETNLRLDMGLSSIGMLYFVIVIETLFSIRFEGVGVSDFTTLGDVVRYIEGSIGK